MQAEAVFGFLGSRTGLPEFRLFSCEFPSRNGAQFEQVCRSLVGYFGLNMRFFDLQNLFQQLPSQWEQVDVIVHIESIFDGRQQLVHFNSIANFWHSTATDDCAGKRSAHMGNPIGGGADGSHGQQMVLRSGVSPCRPDHHCRKDHQQNHQLA